jgi:hypothetical protein
MHMISMRALESGIENDYKEKRLLSSNRTNTPTMVFPDKACASACFFEPLPSSPAASREVGGTTTEHLVFRLQEENGTILSPAICLVILKAGLVEFCYKNVLSPMEIYFYKKMPK